MKVNYAGFIDIYLGKQDLEDLSNGVYLTKNTLGAYNQKWLRVNISPSDEEFYCLGGLGEGFDKDSFQGWKLNPPKTKRIRGPTYRVLIINTSISHPYLDPALMKTCVTKGNKKKAKNNIR